MNSFAASFVFCFHMFLKKIFLQPSDDEWNMNFYVLFFIFLFGLVACGCGWKLIA